MSSAEKDFSNRDFFRPVKQGLVLLLITFLLLALAIGIYVARKILLLFLVGLGFGVVIAPLFPFLKTKFKIPNGLTAAIILILFLTVFLGVIVAVGDLVLVQILPAISEIPNLLQKGLVKFEDYLKDFPGMQSIAQGFRFNIEEYVPLISQSIYNFLVTSGSALFYLIFILAVALYAGLDPHRYKKGFLLAVPNAYRSQTSHYLQEAAMTLRTWIVSQLILMTSVSVLTAIALLIIGIPHWFSLAILAGVLDLIPYVGPFLTGGILVLVALAVDPDKALWALLAATLIQQLENYLLLPWAMKRVRIPPIYLLAFIFVMGNWFGIVGVFVASPILAILRRFFILSQEKK